MTLTDELAHISVLIVEDNPGDYVLIEDYLLDKFTHARIQHFQDYEQTIAWLQRGEADASVILLDLHLPGFNGLQLVEKVLMHSHKIPIIILTGYADLSIAQKSLQLGVYDFLIKDEINPALLHKSIEFAINRRRYIKQIEDEKANYENLFNFSPQPMWLLDYDTLRILNANYSAKTKYGYTIEELRGMTFLQFHPEGESERVRDQILALEHECNEHFTHILKDGTRIRIELHCRNFNMDVRNRYVVVQSSDVTETLHHISTIEIQNKKLREIAWTQSHVMRAPLSRILGIIHHIEDHNTSVEDMMFWVEQLKASSHEMDDIVRKIVEGS